MGGSFFLALYPIGVVGGAGGGAAVCVLRMNINCGLAQGYSLKKILEKKIFFKEIKQKSLNLKIPIDSLIFSKLIQWGTNHI